MQRLASRGPLVVSGDNPSVARDELVTIEGTVDGALVPFVDAVIEAGGEVPIEHRANFALVTNDAQRITIELAKNPHVRPTRKVHGTWSEIQQHVVKPIGDFHPELRVTLRGEWIEPGERICVIGYAKAHDFVPDTGTHREAPERRLSLVRAIAIGVGDDALKHAKKAFDERAKNIDARSKPRETASNTHVAWLLIACFALAIFLVLRQL